MTKRRRETREISSNFTTREDNNKKIIAGYFSVFDSNYEIDDGLSESIDLHAFDNTLDNDIRCLINHDTTLVLGRNKAGTLRIHTDAHGLYCEVEINENDQDAMNIYARVLRGDVNQCSMGFYVRSEEHEIKDDGSCHWTIKDIDLYEVSICTFPAYKNTSINARNDDLKVIKKRENDKFKQKMLEKLGGK